MNSLRTAVKLQRLFCELANCYEAGKVFHKLANWLTGLRTGELKGAQAALRASEPKDFRAALRTGELEGAQAALRTGELKGGQAALRTSELSS